MEYDKGRKILTVYGRVRSVFGSQKDRKSFFASESSSSPGFVRAEQMSYRVEDGRIRYMGNVQLLSENQELKCNVLNASKGLDRIDAEGAIRHLVSRKDPGQGAKGPRAAGSGDLLTVIRSSTMSYRKEKNLISYAGQVTLHSKDADLSSDNLDAIPDSKGKQIQQATARGNVVVHYGARECKGDLADYFLDTKKLVVTGKPAEFYDPNRGRSFARRLTSTTADDTILLEK